MLGYLIFLNCLVLEVTVHSVQGMEKGKFVGAMMLHGAVLSLSVPGSLYWWKD